MILKKQLRYLINKIQFLFRRKDIRFFQKVLYPNVSIFSMNCFGGHIYQDLHWKYTSPTAGLFFFADDFCSILEDISILKRKILFKSASKWDLANQKMKFRSHIYPIGYFQDTDIEIHFLHYHTEQEALSKWNKRMERFNFERFIAIGFQQNLCNTNTIKRFASLNIPNKCLFSNEKLELPSVIYIKEFRDKQESPDPYKYVNIYCRYLARYLKNNPIR